MYTSYIVKFVCFYLQVLANKEQQLYRFSKRQNAAAYTESRSASGSKKEEEEEKSSKEEESSKKDNNSKSSNANSDSPRTQRTTRNQTQQDIVKNARELLT